MGKSKIQKETDAWEADLSRFIRKAAMSEWKYGDSIFTDHESKEGLILRQEDPGGNAYNAGVRRTWVIQCGGKYPLKIGDANYNPGSVSPDEASEIVKRLRAGDEQTIVRAYLTETEYDVAAYNSKDERDLFWRCSLAQIDQMIESGKALLENRSPWYEKDRWRARRRVKVLETMLKGLRDFTNREGLKISKPRPRVVAERARSGRAA